MRTSEVPALRPQPPLATVSVIGLGRVGGPLAACLASRGVEVIGGDRDGRKVAAVNAGAPPVPEPGLGALIGRGRGLLRATRSTEDAVLASDISLIAVPTPAEEDGSLSLRYLRPACEEIGRALRLKSEFHVVAVASTVMPGTTSGVLTPAIAEASGKRPDSEFATCYLPEFVALGTAIQDFLSPDFVLIGESHSAAGELLENLFRAVCQNDPPVAHTSVVEAELAKLAVNAFLATKITFANVLAQVCEGLSGCDVDVVTSVIGGDNRIGAEYLRGGMGFGGPCLPRDTAALATLAYRLDAPTQLADAVLAINDSLLDRLAALVRAALPLGGRVGICGLAFKPGTAVLEDSPGASLADRLAAEGVPVIAFDPLVTEPDRRALGDTIEFAASLDACIAAADVVVLAAPAEGFAEFDPRSLDRDGRKRTVIDPWRVLGSAEIATATPSTLRDASRGAAAKRPRLAGQPS